MRSHTSNSCMATFPRASPRMEREPPFCPSVHSLRWSSFGRVSPPVLVVENHKSPSTRRLTKQRLAKPSYKIIRNGTAPAKVLATSPRSSNFEQLQELSQEIRFALSKLCHRKNFFNCQCYSRPAVPFDFQQPKKVCSRWYKRSRRHIQFPWQSSRKNMARVVASEPHRPPQYKQCSRRCQWQRWCFDRPVCRRVQGCQTRNLKNGVQPLSSDTCDSGAECEEDSKRKSQWFWGFEGRRIPSFRPCPLPGLISDIRSGRHFWLVAVEATALTPVTEDQQQRSTLPSTSMKVENPKWLDPVAPGASLRRSCRRSPTPMAAARARRFTCSPPGEW